MPTVCEQATSDEAEKFAAIVTEWKRRRGHSSKVRDLEGHYAYQQIIGIGPAIIPLLLREMEERPSHWHSALCSMTGANPVPKESVGKLEQMAAAWVQWGRDQGYQW